MIELITQIDHEILIFIQENLRFEWMTEPTIFVSHLGDHGKIWIILCLILLLFKRTRKAGLCGLIALLINLLITNVTLKPLVARIRPYEQFNDLMLLLERQKDFSFPSGHTSSSFAAAWAIFTMHRDGSADGIQSGIKGRMKGSASVLGIASMVLAIWIGWSRLYVAVHFPTDVIVGALIGIFSAWAAGKIIRLIEIRWQERQKKYVMTGVSDVSEKEEEAHE